MKLIKLHIKAEGHEAVRDLVSGIQGFAAESFTLSTKPGGTHRIVGRGEGLLEGLPEDVEVFDYNPNHSNRSPDAPPDESNADSQVWIKRTAAFLKEGADGESVPV